jgi:hypothetical protein
MPLVLAACGGGGGSMHTATSGYRLGAPATATIGNNPPLTANAGFQQAATGGPSFAGTGSGLPPAGTVFALTQSAYQFPSSGGSADTQTMAEGATFTVVDLSNGMVELKIPNLGVDAVVTDDGVTTTSVGTGKTLVFGLNGEGTTGTVLSSLNYTALGSWTLANASTGLATNTAYYVAGYQTPTGSMPTSGSATYGGIGTVKGALFVSASNSAQLAGDSTLTANFATGLINGTFTNMTATPVSGGAATPWNNVSVTANISGAALSGRTAAAPVPSSTYGLGVASGTIAGGFYGPNADEIGAVWTLYDGTKAAIGGVAGPKTPSDRRLKRDIRPLATKANGLRLYSFRYLSDTRRFVGVMAQDLLADPRFAAAVSRRPSGVILVDYARLGLEVADMSAMREAGEAAIAAYEAAIDA